MTDTPVVETPVTTTDSNPQVSSPINSAKPYDDDLLDAYAEQHAEETKEANKNEVSKETTPKEEEKSVEEKSEETKPEESGAKSKEGDKVEDGFEDVVIKKPINGKEVEFKVKDAIQAFVKQEEFNRNMDRRITHVSQREKRWEADQQNFKSKIDKVIEVAQGGDFVTGIRALAKLAAGSSGLDVVKFEKQYFEQLDKVREVYTKMTPEQRESYFAKRALAEAKAETEKLQEEKTVNTERSQLEQKVAALQKQHSLPENEFWENYKVLEDSQVGEGKAFKTSQDIQPEDVIKYSLAVRHEIKVLQAGEKVGIKDDAILDEVSRITAINPDLTVDDIVTVIKNAGIAKNAPPDAVENLNRKAQKSNNGFTQASSTKKENGKVEGWDKEDLDFLYRKQPKVFTRPTR